jgi:thiol-disulfide isomerase/thioredoxin
MSDPSQLPVTDINSIKPSPDRHIKHQHLDIEDIVELPRRLPLSKKNSGWACGGDSESCKDLGNRLPVGIRIIDDRSCTAGVNLWVDTHRLAKKVSPRDPVFRCCSASGWFARRWLLTVVDRRRWDRRERDMLKKIFVKESGRLIPSQGVGMKKFLRNLVWLTGGLVMTAESAWAVKVGDLMPKISVKGQDGAMSEPWAGKPTLINFWATWCEACKVELKEMSEEMKKAPASVRVVFVSLDKDPAKAKDWMSREFKSNAAMIENLFYDDQFKLPDALGVESFPMTLVVDSAGNVLKIQEGFKEGTGSTKALFDTLNAAPNK